MPAVLKAAISLNFASLALTVGLVKDMKSPFVLYFFRTGPKPEGALTMAL